MTVFHLKYRPQKIADLDLSKVRETLKKVLANKGSIQSFLFSGPKGAGKTSAARILARALNCLSPEGVEPCGVCENCVEILRGGSMDVIEMDAASNRGIEDIRSLKDKAILVPSKLKYKVFVIDEVHMLTKEAFNAMLKLIEEPPKHTVFILCTTDPEKIPDTVLSRLVKVDFTKGTEVELKTSLDRIVRGEGVEIEDGAVQEIIRKSDGSFRNLQRTFNEIYLNFGNKITEKDVVSFFGEKVGDYSEVDFENDLVIGKAGIILEKLEKMADKGADFTDFRGRLLLHFQKKLLSFFGVDGVDSKLKLNEVEKILNLLIMAGKQEKSVNIDQLPMQLAIVEYFGDENKGNESINLNVDNKKEAAEVIVTTVKMTKDNFGLGSLEEKVIEEKKDECEDENGSDFQVVSETSVITCGCKIEDVEKGWNEILNVIKPLNHSVEAFLRAARPKHIEGNVLIVEVFYPFHKDRLEEARNRKIVEEGLTRVLKSNLAFECVLSTDKKRPLVISNDTPMEKVSEQLAKEEVKTDIYDVAKEIFG